MQEICNSALCFPDFVIYVTSAHFTYVKGIFSDFHNIFSCMNLETKTKKSLFQKFQLIPILRFQVMHDYVCFIVPMENCFHFILKLFQANSFGELCFLEESYGNMQKIQILKTLKSALYSTSVSMPLLTTVAQEISYQFKHHTETPAIQ